ncbi:P-loop NTPase fold protein [Paraburkholderia sp. FT54]|uniref:P-loop NTPase fold protein n=1 Tax=Paraburkholderia sp. FT54 TaxID=3074437 RepID=UPI0028776DD0|nr:P-loop NTPase fold protein [Paraburkholderia sp. FT54]WNC90228.1 P-loop NTPase fold protein [Paraburkholderia sp. FT54]
MTFQQPKLLPDEPAVADSFGAHERIANALATLIDTSEGGKSIRLDGDWGAGKSTVIQILRKRLSGSQQPQREKNPSTRTFVYDAWVHSGDGLRRAFFESLVKDLRACEWISPKSDADKMWDKKLSTMAGKRKHVEKLVRPEFSQRTRVAIALSIAGALCYPAVHALISKAVQHLPAWLLWVWTACAAVIVFGFALEISALDLRVLLTKSTSDETTETLTDPEPTSIEFQEEFERLMEDVLNPRYYPTRKLVIVIDNLDRIGFDEAKQVWTLLRSFLDNPAFRESEWFNRLWLLVPIASESRLSNDTDLSHSNGNTLEKVFQVRMSLPLPMLRPWKDFLAKKLEHCFGPDADGSYEVIARLLQATTAGAAPTPRQIVVFLNELVALYTERQGDMQLSTLAAYILSRDRARAQPWQVPFEISKVLYSSTMEQDFATLYLHAAKSPESLYLLILPNLQRALEMGEPNELYKILGSSSAALDILDNHLIESFSRMSASAAEAQKEQALFFAFLRALVMFADQTLAGQFSTGFLAHIRPRIDQVMRLTSSLELSNPNVTDGVDAYLKLTFDHAFAGAKVSNLLHAISGIPETNSPIAPGAWDNWTRSLIELLSNEKVRTAANISAGQRISLPVPIERWASICAELEAETDPNRRFVLETLDISADSEKVADWIVTELLPMNVDNRAARVLLQGLRARGSEFFNLVTDKIVQVFRARPDLPRSEILACLTCLVEVSNQHAKPFLKQLAGEGWFLVWARSSPNSFTLDEPFIRFATFRIWAQDGLADKPTDHAAVALISSIRNAFGAAISSSNLVATVSTGLILRTKIYDVLPIIASIAAGKNGILKQILVALCNDAEFLDVARNELREDWDASEGRLLVGQSSDVVRNLLIEVMNDVAKSPALSAEQDVVPTSVG